MDVDVIGPDDPSNGIDGTVAARVVPDVCGAMAWDANIPVDRALDVSVVGRDIGGATVFSAPLAGGTLFGFQVTPRMEGNEAVKLPIDGAFDKVTVSYVQQRPVSAAAQDGAIYLHMFDDKLVDAEYIAKVEGTALADPSFFSAGGNLVMPVATNNGLVMHRFHDSLEPIDSKLFYPTKPIQSLTAAQLDTYMMIAWSTETECYLSWNTTYEPGVLKRVDRACPNPKLAMNQATGDAILTFDSIEGVRMMPIHLTMFGGDAPVLSKTGSSPRTLFDGERFWISYLDVRGDVIVGFLDDDHKPVTMSLGAPQPERAAYELAMVNGAATVFSIDQTGYTGYRMCVAKTLE
jgi:hypothetical protein